MRPWHMMMSALIVLPLLAACGDEKDDTDPGETKTPTTPSTGTATTGLDSKKVSELTASEGKTLCEWGNSLSDDSLTDKELCTQDAADFAESVDECEELRDDCLENPGDVTGPDDCTTFKLPKGCNSKVSALKKCISEISKQDDKAAKGATCETYEDHATPVELPDSCNDIELECLDFEVSINTDKTWRRG